MTTLARVYTFKIAGTLLFWSLPLLLLPPALFAKLGIVLPTTLGVRLLGWAYLSLCLGYAFGLAGELNGERNLPVLWMGLTSNAGATVLLFFFAMFDPLFQSHLVAQVYLLLSGLGTLGITVGLARAALEKDGPPGTST